MRKLASIRKINSLEPIAGADRIELARVDGWRSIVKKGDYQVGDFVVYFEIDSFLPEVEEFEFLRKNCYKKMANGSTGFRLRTIKLRGEISQGLIMPMTLIDTHTFGEGDDVTEVLGVKKYEAPIPAELGGDAKGAYPSFISKTDEERLQNFEERFEELKGYRYYVTEKLDGSSMTVFHNRGEFGVCGRNWEYLMTDTNSLWRVALRHKLDEKLSELGRNIAIQGEIVGEGIQKNLYKLTGQHMYAFNVFDIDEHKYLPKMEAQELCKSLGVNIVPVIDPSMKLPDTVEEAVLMAENFSRLNPKAIREGLVWVSLDSPRRVSFKTISNSFLLEHEY